MNSWIFRRHVFKISIWFVGSSYDVSVAAEQTVCVDSRGVCVFSLASCCWYWRFLQSERSSSLKGELSAELHLFHCLMFNFFHYNFLHPSEAARVCTAVNDTCERLCPSMVCFNYNFKTYVHLWLQLLHQTRRHKAAKMVQKDSTHCTAGGIYGVFMGEDEVKHAEMFQEMKR